MDKDLAARLGVAASVAIAPYLKSIHDQIMNTEGANSLKAVIDIKFAVDGEGIVDVDITARVPLKSPGRVIRLRSVRDQLSLFTAAKPKADTKTESRFPEAVDGMSKEDQEAIANAIGER